MENVAKDALAVVFRDLSVRDWGAVRTMSTVWRDTADRVDVVGPVYVRAGGRAEKGIDGGEYKRRLFELLRVGRVFLRDFHAHEAVPFALPSEEALQGVRYTRCNLVLGPAGLPDHFVSVAELDSEDSRLFVWNGRKRVLERTIDIGRLRVLGCHRTEAGEPRLSAVVGDALGRLELWDPLSGKRIQQSVEWQLAERRVVAPPLFVSGPNLPCSRLLVFGANAVGTTFRFFDSTTLDSTETYAVDRVYSTPFNWEGHVGLSGELRLSGGQCISQFNVLSGQISGGRDADAVKAVRIEDRTHLVVQVRRKIYWKGTCHSIELDPHSLFSVRGGHWGGHDYILLSPPWKVAKVVHVWRDDGKAWRHAIEALKRTLPRASRWQLIPDGRHYGLGAFVPVGNGLVWAGDNQVRPIALIPSEATGVAHIRRQQKRQLLVGALALLATVVLIRKLAKCWR